MTADGYINKYHAIDIVSDLKNSYEYQIGHITIISHGVAVQGHDIWFSNDATLNLTPFDKSYHMDGTPIVGQNPGYIHAKLDPTGKLDMYPLPPGKYTYHLSWGNGDQEESGNFTIVAHEYTTVVVLGSAYSASTTPEVSQPILVPPPYPPYRPLDCNGDGYEYC